tara:strand:- start:6662 stop:7564 length:903 start_codon:yes stop_codon:yes gene_type:complete
MKIKYDKQDEEWSACAIDKNKKKHADRWLKKNTLDYWRHQRMLSPLKAFIKDGDKWLTLGDGRYGTEANFLISNGAEALATDYSDKLLKIAKEIGFIKAFKKENAESLSFKDNEFDYVLIKEAFHHFPRPWIALYEAFRVCKKGVILIEPNDQINHKLNIFSKFFKKTFNIYKSFKGIKTNKDCYAFEEVGNFIYTTNTRELEKFLLGMHYRHIGFIELNDHYIKGVEYIELSDKKLLNKIKIIFFKLIIYLKETLTKLRLLNNSLNINILFKKEPNNKLKEKMKSYKWNYKILPVNPYL